MRKAILGSVGALAVATPAFAADLPVQPRYSEVPGYEYRSAPPAVVEELPPVAPETYVVRALCLRSATASSCRRIPRLCITTGLCSTSVCVCRPRLAWRMGPSWSLPRALVNVGRELDKQRSQADAVDCRRRRTLAKRQRMWAEIANSVLADTGDEGRAIREANAMVGRDHEKPA